MSEEPEQNPESSMTSAPAGDRRRHARQRINSLSYVQLGDGNGGIVLNISEGGIAVAAAQPLDEGEGVITMRIEIPRSRKRLEVSGEIAWIGESRKEAGLRFAGLQEDALKRIRGWMAREASPGTAEEEIDAEDEAPVVRANEAVGKTLVTEDDFGARQDITVEADERAAEEEEPISELEALTEDDEEGATEPDEDFAEEAEEPAISMKSPVPRAVEPPAVPSVIHKEEDRQQKIAPPALTFEKKTQIPISPYNAISGTHGAPAFAMAPAPSAAPRNTSTDAGATLFPKVHAAVEARAADDGWKSFRVQLQSGWFLALLVLLLATISFAAGMLVRRGALNSVMGDADDMAQPRSAPASSAGSVVTNPSATSSNAATAPAKPLQIEIVDSSNHRWTIPAATGANHGDTSATRQTQESDAAPSAGEAAGSAASNSPSQNTAPAASSSGPATAKSSAPLMLSLPETPISASGSIAIRATSMIPMPEGDAQTAQHTQNLKIGQLNKMVEPVYPPDARQARVEGTVKLHVVVGVDGKVESLQPVSGPESLTQAAMTAVRDWRYSPTLLNGKPVEMQEDVSFVFRLPD
jgi:TonB family protein